MVHLLETQMPVLVSTIGAVVVLIIGVAAGMQALDSMIHFGDQALDLDMVLEITFAIHFFINLGAFQILTLVLGVGAEMVGEIPIMEVIGTDVITDFIAMMLILINVTSRM